MADPFVAEIRMFGCNFAPRSWAYCNGQILPIAQNTALFSLLGTTYGGNGTTNFALPNLQGSAANNMGQGPGLSDYVLGQTGGTGSVTLTANTGSSYLWSRNGLFTGQSGNTANINIDALGNYTLTVTDVAGCSAISNTISISDSSSRKLFIYPNPTSGKFQVRFYSDINNLNPRLLAIYDSKGALVHKGKYVIFGAYTSIAIDLSAMTSGIYYVYLMDVDGKKLATDKVLITR